MSSQQRGEWFKTPLLHQKEMDIIIFILFISLVIISVIENIIYGYRGFSRMARSGFEQTTEVINVGGRMFVPLPM